MVLVVEIFDDANELYANTLMVYSLVLVELDADLALDILTILFNKAILVSGKNV